MITFVMAVGRERTRTVTQVSIAHALMCTFLECFFIKNTLKFVRALRAPCFGANLAKNTLLRLLVRRYEKQKSFPLVFSPPVSFVAARSAAKFSFFPWDFSSETVSERR